MSIFYFDEERSGEKLSAWDSQNIYFGYYAASGLELINSNRRHECRNLLLVKLLYYEASIMSGILLSKRQNLRDQPSKKVLSLTL